MFFPVFLFLFLFPLQTLPLWRPFVSSFDMCAVYFAAGFNGLPFGLLLVMVCGAELFTGNVALLATAVCIFLPCPGHIHPRCSMQTACAAC